jgi:hypothetical protein
MRSNRPFSIFLGLALGLVYSVNAQPGSNANGAEPLSIDLSRFQNQKFVTDGETNTL